VRRRTIVERREKKRKEDKLCDLKDPKKRRRD